jgi:hypothetical protein
VVEKQNAVFFSFRQFFIFLLELIDVMSTCSLPNTETVADAKRKKKLHDGNGALCEVCHGAVLPLCDWWSGGHHIEKKKTRAGGESTL